MGILESRWLWEYPTAILLHADMFDFEKTRYLGAERLLIGSKVNTGIPK